MNFVVFLLLSLFSIVLQSTVFVNLTVFGVKPDLILLLTVLFSIFCGPQKGGALGFFVGLLQDLYLGSFIGMSALAKGVTCVMTGWIAKGAFRENMLVPIIAMFMGTLLHESVYLILGKLIGLPWGWSLWLWRGIPAALYNACLVPFVYSFFYDWAAQKNEELQTL